MSQPVAIPNHTVSEYNGTTVVIKQVFLTIDPMTYVRWDDLFLIAIYVWVFYALIACSLRKVRRQQRQHRQADTEPVVINEDGAVRVIQVSTSS